MKFFKYVVVVLLSSCLYMGSGGATRQTVYPSYQYSNPTSYKGNASPQPQAKLYVDDSSQDVIDIVKFSDFVKVFNEYKKSFPEKSQYESTTEFEARCNGDGEQISFKLSYIASARKVFFKYDADKKIARVTLPHGSASSVVGYVSGKSCNLFSDSIRMSSSDHQLGSYVGTNAFGVSKTVKQYQFDSYYLMPVDVNGNLKNSIYLFDIPMEPAEAQELAGNYMIAIQARPKCNTCSNSVAATRKDYSTPTINSPVEGRHNSHGLSVVLDRIVIYNEKTKRQVVSRKFIY